jgi:hypothetical protein
MLISLLMVLLPGDAHFRRQSGHEPDAGYRTLPGRPLLPQCLRFFVETARSLGFGERIVCGYLYHPDQSMVESADPSRRMIGQKSSCRALAGSRLPQQTAASAVSI